MISTRAGCSRPVVARQVVSVDLPRGMRATTIGVALVGVPEPVLRAWLESYTGGLRLQRPAQGNVEAELRFVPPSSGGSFCHTSFGGRQSPLRWDRRRPDDVYCGQNRLQFGGDGGDTLTVNALGDNDSTTVRLLLDLWLSRVLARRGVAYLHAAAFQAEDRRVLACGPSGAGKSTLAAAALGLGGRVVSDDLLMAGPAVDGGPWLAPSRHLLAFRPPGVDLLPARLRKRLERWPDPDEERWVLSRSPGASWALNGMGPPHVLCEVTVDRRLRASRITPVSQARALAALLRSTPSLFLSPRFARERAALLPVLRELATSCQACRVRLGRDLLSEPARCLRRLVLTT